MGIHDQTIPELPTLESGVQLLETTGGSRGPLHALVADHVLRTGGNAYWIDSHGHATTRPLYRLAPHFRLLDRIHVARGFTAFQHHALVDSVSPLIDEETSLLVLPALDGQYRSDSLRRTERTNLLTRTIATIAAIAREHDLPVLITKTRDDAFADPVVNAAREVIECEHTRFGPRFVADDFETLVYPDSSGHVQTTLTFWKRVLAARQPLYERPSTTIPSPPEVTADGSY